MSSGKESDSKPPRDNLGMVELAKNNIPQKELDDKIDDALGVQRSPDSYADPNWVWSDINPKNWNKSFPFQFHIIKMENNSPQIIEEFTLPIPPSDFSISTPFAISTSVTLGGIIEEHNGAPLRNINFSGTTGVYPLRGTTEKLKSQSFVEGIFAGTITSVGNVAQQVSSLAKNASSLVNLPGSPQNSPNLLSDLESEIPVVFDYNAKTSGYYQFRLLQKFLEKYVNLKKTKEGRDYRLAFSVWKDDATYLITPRAFDVRRSASSPFEYNYNLSLLAWSRIKLKKAPGNFEGYKPIVREPDKFRQLLNTIESARRVLQAARGTLNAASADVERIVFEPVRGVILFAKDLLGVGITAADLPRNTVKKFINNYNEILNDLRATSKGLQDFQSSLQDYWNSQSSELKATGVGDVTTLQKAANLPRGKNEEPASSNEIVRMFEYPSEYLEIFEKIKPSSLNLAPAVEAEILGERRRVREFDRAHFETIRDQVSDFANSFANSIGAGSLSFSELSGLPAPVSNRTPTDEEYEALFALNSTVIELNRLAASGLIDNNTFTTTDVMAGLASRSGIAFTSPTSKFAVPFPYGITLERLAQQYLGDANRWHEIAALNGLRYPYVDEEGFELPLLVNGRENQIIVADSSNLYVGQPVWISSNTAARTKRKITKIDKISESSSILTLDGDSDLDKYKVLAKANMQAFLPDTVNSQMTIYIPSSQPAQDDDFRTKSIPGVDEQDPYLRAGGVDLLLTQNGDLAITPDGDCRLAIGLTNLIQRLKIAIETPRGSLIQHPQYGLGISPGMSTADLNAEDLKSAIEEIVKADGGFTGVQRAAILKQGAVAQIFVSVGVAGASQYIPVSFQVKK